KIVLFLLQGKKAQSRVGSDCRDGHTPVGTTLGNRRGDRIVRTGLGQVASGSGVAKEAVDQNACPTASIAVNEDARKICQRRRDRSLHGLPLEPIITLAKHDSLQSAVTGDELQFVPQVWPVVLLGFGIKQVDAGKVTLTAPGSGQSARAADSEELA